MEKPRDLNDIAGVLGRVTSLGINIRTPNLIQFGASVHVSNALLAANKFNSLFRSAINIRNNQNIIKICESNFKCSRYFRSKEPEQIKNLEGSSIKWGVNDAFGHEPGLELVYHDGNLGKEPMVIVFGYNPRDVLQKVEIILQKYVNN